MVNVVVIHIFGVTIFFLNSRTTSRRKPPSFLPSLAVDTSIGSVIKRKVKAFLPCKEEEEERGVLIQKVLLLKMETSQKYYFESEKQK
jgi:hypothetical protein